MNSSRRNKPTGQEWYQYNEEMNSTKEDQHIQIENDINATGEQIPQ
jgi:hypothetical protein